MDKEVENWKKRTRRKGPFYLLRMEPYLKEWTRSDGMECSQKGFTYYIIWHESNLGKTKLGTVHDYMHVRYGINTISVLNGERPHDLWNGHLISDIEFDEMLKVRQGKSDLPMFDIDMLQNLTS